MGNSLLDLQPYVVSRNLRGYSVFFYGEPKTGKTTTASKFPDSLIMAFEQGYKALPGVFAKDITSWGGFKKTIKELENEDVKKRFSTIIVDTADIAYDFCCKYVASQNDAESVEEVPFGKGYNKAQREFDEQLRKILMMGYGLVIISHAQDKTFKNENGDEYNQIVPTVDKRGALVCSRMCDIFAYARPVENNQVKLYLRGTPRFQAGSRFKYIAPVIDFNYDNLVNSILDAIEKQEAENGSTYFTNEVHEIVEVTLNYDDLFEEIQTIIGQYLEVNKDYYQPRIKEVIEKELGKGKKVSECSRDQVEQLDVIVDGLRRIPVPNN